MYRVDVIAEDVNGFMSVLSGPELKKIFEDIIKITSDVKEYVRNPAILTTQGRSEWAQVNIGLQVKWLAC